jgi:hypothetical protein
MTKQRARSAARAPCPGPRNLGAPAVLGVACLVALGCYEGSGDGWRATSQGSGAGGATNATSTGGTTGTAGATSSGSASPKWSADLSGMDSCSTTPHCKITFGTAACDACSHSAAHSTECGAIGQCASDPGCCQMIACYTAKCATAGDNAAVGTCLQANCPNASDPNAVGLLQQMLISNNADCPCW